MHFVPPQLLFFMHRPEERDAHNIVRSKPPNQHDTPAGLIVVVSNMAWTIFNYRLPVIRALQALGYKIIIVAPVDESVSRLMNEPGIELFPLKKFIRNTTGITSNLAMISEFYQVYRQLKPDFVIHFGLQANIFGNFGAWLARVKSICVVTGLGYTFLHNGLVPWLTRWLYRISFVYPEKVLFENKEDLDLLVKSRMVQRSKTLHVPGCGVDTKVFRPQPTYFNSGRLVFLFIGRLLYDKGLREYAAAAKQLKTAYPQAECWILGHLDDENPAHIQREELVQWVQGGFIHYKGVKDDVRPIIAQCDWVVLPSYREGLSRVLLEAMAMSKPIITTDAPGCKETVVDGKSGFIVPVRNTEALYNAMKTCCTLSSQTQKEMGAYGRQMVIRTYEARIVGNIFADLIKQLHKKAV